MKQVDTTQTTLQGLESLPYLEMGSGFVIGLAVGYVLKKSFKLLLFLLGVAVIALFFLEREGVIVLNEEVLQNDVNQGISLFKENLLFIKERLSSMHIGSGVSTVAGFFAGLKMG